jgi:cell division protein FtsQ
MTAMALFNAYNSALPSDVRMMNAASSVLMAVAACLLAGLALMWAARQPAFTLRSIRVEGDVGRYNAATLQSRVAQSLKGNFFTLDLNAGRQVFESVPWVRHAALHRVWPNRLTVQIEEHRAAAVWGRDGNDDKLVNTHGEIFDADYADVEEELPTLDGPEGASARMLSMLEQLRTVLAPMNAPIDALLLSGRGSWRVELDGGAEIELGRGEEAEVVERTRRFVATALPLIARYGQPIEAADLRHNQAYALRLRGVSTTSGAASAAPGK